MGVVVGYRYVGVVEGNEVGIWWRDRRRVVWWSSMCTSCI